MHDNLVKECRPLNQLAVSHQQTTSLAVSVDSDVGKKQQKSVNKQIVSFLQHMVLNLTHFERQSLTQTFPHASSGCHVTGGGI